MIPTTRDRRLYRAHGNDQDGGHLGREGDVVREAEEETVHGEPTTPPDLARG
jgi:hypothetical protein